MIKIFAFFLIGLSMFVSLICAIGYIKFNNVYKQIHISTINDMLNIPILFFAIALMFLFHGNKMIFLKIVGLIILWYIVAPITNYCIIKIVYFYTKNQTES